MYSLPSASQMCEPCPRTIKGASHSTALNARTGELTPPGISCSARFCRRRHSSSLRGIYLPVLDQTTSQLSRGPSCLLYVGTAALGCPTTIARIPKYRQIHED